MLTDTAKYGVLGHVDDNCWKANYWSLNEK